MRVRLSGFKIPRGCAGQMSLCDVQTPPAEKEGVLVMKFITLPFKIGLEDVDHII